jgi:thymidine kinase
MDCPFSSHIQLERSDELMNVGKITVFTGPMFSEKSGALIDRCLKFEKFGEKKVKVFKPIGDIRSAEDFIESRMGYKFPATSIPEQLTEEVIAQIYEMVQDVDVVGFDEVQFFSKAIIGIVEELSYQGKQVLVDGLNMDYRGKEFGYIGGLLAIADEIKKLEAFCSVCKSPEARYTQRIVNGKPAKHGAIIQIGDTGDYEPRCRRCYVPPHKA